VFIDEQDAGNANIFVYAGALFFGGGRGKWSASYVTSPLMACIRKIPQTWKKATVKRQPAFPHCSEDVL